MLIFNAMLSRERARVRRVTSARAHHPGQALVEFALILPVLLMLTLGVVDFSRIFFAQIALANAVREGALYAAEGDRTVAATYVAHIKSRMQPELDAAGLTASSWIIQCTTSANAVGATWVTCVDGVKPTFVKVGANTEVHLITPFFPTIPMSNVAYTSAIGPAPTPVPSASASGGTP